VTWGKALGGLNHVKVLINANSTDADLVALRADVIAKGGSVFYNYVSVRALSAMVPVTALNALAARTDVINISPNRPASRHASLLQLASGADPVLPLAAGGHASTGLNGAGVGIAILDSASTFATSTSRTPQATHASSRWWTSPPEAQPLPTRAGPRAPTTAMRCAWCSRA
jgi:hypothetical protein